MSILTPKTHFKRSRSNESENTHNVFPDPSHSKIGKWTNLDQSVHLITNPDQFFILKIFLSPDWSLSDNVLIGSLGGWAQRLLERTCDWSNFGPSDKKQFLVSQYPGL